MLRKPPDILITTPESLYLLLTSQAREILRGVETLIVDEVHAVAGTKRGAHLALSLERLERLVDEPVQRIGLSATQRPLEEIGRFVSGARDDRARRRRHRARSSTSRSSCRSRTCASRVRHRSGRRRRLRELDLAVDLPRAPRARRGAPLDDRLRQQPPPRRAARAAAERAGRGGESRARTTARSRASSASRSRSC